MLKRFLNIPPGSVLNSASAVNRSTSISSSRSSTDTRLGSLARMWTLYHWSGSRLLIVCWNVPGRTVLWRSPFRRISWLNELLPGDHSILADVGEMQVTCTWLGAKFASEGRKQTVGKKSDEPYKKNKKNKFNWNDSLLPSNLTCRSLENLKNFNLNINTISLSSSYRYNYMQGSYQSERYTFAYCWPLPIVTTAERSDDSSPCVVMVRTERRYVWWKNKKK